MTADTKMFALVILASAIPAAYIVLGKLVLHLSDGVMLIPVYAAVILLIAGWLLSRTRHG